MDTHCKLVLDQYREYEYDLFNFKFVETDATRKKSSSREASHVSYPPDDDEESGDEHYRDAEGV